MARETNAEIARQIAQGKRSVPPGYSWNPRHDPPLYKTGGRDDDTDERQVDNRLPNVVDTGTNEGGDDDAETQE